MFELIEEELGDASKLDAEQFGVSALFAETFVQKWAEGTNEEKKQAAEFVDHMLDKCKDVLSALHPNYGAD